MSEDFEMSEAQRDIRYHLHSQTNPARLSSEGPMIFTHGKGCHVYTNKGQQLIDAMAGLWCTSLGFSHPRLAKAASEQYEKFGFYHTFNQKTPDITIRLAEEMVRLSPIADAHVYFATSGSEAIETMVKLAWMHHAGRGEPQRRKIITRQRSFHGSTIVAASMTGLPRMHREFGLPLPGFLHTACPDFYREGRPGETEQQFVSRLAAELEQMIAEEGPESIAAFVAEPINAGGGIVVPPAGYFAAIQAVLNRYGILCLADEIVCGFGRTGNWFGCETVGMKPDMLAVAKGLTSSYFPVSAVYLSDEICQSLTAFNRDGSLFGHGFTNSGHPVGAAVALETLAVYHEMEVVSHVRKMGNRLKEGLLAISNRSAIVGQVRGEGLMIGVELMQNPEQCIPFPAELAVGAAFDRYALANGLIIRAMGDVIGFCPPLIAGEQEIDEILTLFAKTLDETEKQFSAL